MWLHNNNNNSKQQFNRNHEVRNTWVTGERVWMTVRECVPGDFFCFWFFFPGKQGGQRTSLRLVLFVFCYLFTVGPGGFSICLSFFLVNPKGFSWQSVKCGSRCFSVHSDSIIKDIRRLNPGLIQSKIQREQLQKCLDVLNIFLMITHLR